MSARGTKFTLIELLIVIAIIVIMAGLLLPALSKTRGRAKALECVNNLKTMGVSQSGYSDDYQEWIVPATVTNQMSEADKALYSWDSRHWYGLLSGYREMLKKSLTPGYGATFYGSTETKGTFVCPGEPEKFGAYASGMFTYTHYAINWCLSGISNTRTAAYYYQRRLVCLTQPSQAMLLCDSIYTSNYVIAGLNHPAFRHGSSDPRQRVPTPAAADITTGFANVLFMDGHVGNATYRKMFEWAEGVSVHPYFSGYKSLCRGFDTYK